MSDNLIFNSMDNPVPAVRKDIQLIPLQYNGDRVLYVHDIMEYIPSDFALNPHVESFLTLFNGRFSIQRILAMVEGQIDGQDLLQFVQLLDKNCLLESPNYRETARQKEEAFELSPARGAALAGNSYPEDPDELEKYLSDLFSPFTCSESVQFPEKALYAPHIDPKAGGDVYAKAFSVLRTLTPERVVILGTSHYAGCYPELYANTPFIGSRKIFELPNGRIPTDSGYLEELERAGETIGYTAQDRAHRIEHSIELHLLFARHIWQHDFSVVPILVNSFEDLFYFPESYLREQLERFFSFLKAADDNNTFYLISGDLAHVGKKFGDKIPAAEMKKDVESFDRKFIQSATDNNPDELFRLLHDFSDRYRTCGFPPLYTFLKAFSGLKGTEIDYHWWDETERESAVSFGAISY